MKIPARGHREAAAAWIAFSVAVLTAIAGTVAVLVVRGDLPSRILVRQDFDGTSRVSTPQGIFLVVAAIVTIGASLLAMAVDLALRRAPRAETSGWAAGLPVLVGLLVYSVVLAQRGGGDRANWTTWPLAVGLALGAAVGFGLYRWARQLPELPGLDNAELSPQAPLLDAPESVRLAWVGRSTMSWPIRVAQGSVLVVPMVFFWWNGTYPTAWWVPVMVLAPFALKPFFTRPRQLVVDYSRVGMGRGGGSAVPYPVHISQIRSAEATTISALRDFGGWGRRKRPGGEDAWIGRSGEALVVHRIGKPDVTLTVDGAEEDAAVLNTHVVRYRAWVAENQSSIDLPHPYGDRV